jgi:hypothetical protein
MQGAAWRGEMVRRATAEALAVLAAAGCLAFAVLADRAWLERHFLFGFFQPREVQVTALSVARGVALVAAILLAWPVRTWLGRLAARRTLREFLVASAPTLLAVVLALGASELLLRNLPWRATHQPPGQREPLRRWSPELGWTYVPSRTGYGEIGGRRIEYAFDASGHRVASQAAPLDYDAPSIVFLGESIMAGHGLTWSESVPAQVEALTGVRAANLAVGGYATDQAYLRLRAEWPRFRDPRAVVVLFMPSLFHRNLDRDRPHLVRGLVLRPPSDDWRLAQLAKRAIPYRSDREIAEGIAATQDALRAIVRMAQSRGAVPLILVPQFGPESAEEAALRRRVLDSAGLPYVQVPLDDRWRLPNNRHPDARGAAAMARAVAAELRARGLQPGRLRG